MRNALILHGKPKRESFENPNIPNPHEANWLPGLRDELAKRGIKAAIPIFPKPYSPEYDAWKAVFEEYEVTDETSIVGHSAGADFALRWLSEHEEARIDQLLLVAPWRDTAAKYGEFSRYDLSPDLSERVRRISIFNSSDDSSSIQANVAVLRLALPQAHYIGLRGMGHCMLGNKMQTVEFPELLDGITNE